MFEVVRTFVRGVVLDIEKYGSNMIVLLIALVTILNYEKGEIKKNTNVKTSNWKQRKRLQGLFLSLNVK